MAATLQPPPIDTPQDGPDGLFSTVWQRFFISLRAISQLWTQQPFVTYKASTDLTSPQNLGLLATGFLKTTLTGAVATISSTASIPVSGGGTGDTTLTAHGVLIGEGTSPVAVTAAGAAKTVLIGQGAADPLFSGSPEVTNMTVDLVLIVDSPTFVVDAVNHVIGIGTATPGATDKLTVIGTIKLGSGPDAAGFFLTTAAGVNRWLMRLKGAEGGANSGSDYAISARDDSGASLFPNVFMITRATGAAAFTQNLSADSPTFFVDAATHRVGVGTAAPAQGFHSKGGNGTGFLVDNNGSQFTEIDFANNGTVRGSWYWDETNSLFNFGLGSGAFKWVFSNGNIEIGALISKYKGIATVNGGVPAEYATIDSTGLTANVTATTLYAVPASGEGMYRVSAYVVETVAGSVSSVLPNVQILYTDKDSNVAVTIDATPILGAAGLGQTGALNANTGGTVSSGVIVIYVKASTTIQYQTSNYASVAAGMTYALRIRLELL